MWGIASSAAHDLGVTSKTTAGIFKVESFSEAQQDLLDNDNVKMGEITWWTDSFDLGAKDASCSFYQTARLMLLNQDHPMESFLDDYIQKGMYCSVSDDLYQDGANCGKCFSIQVGASGSIIVQVVNDGAGGSDHFDCFDTAYQEMSTGEELVKVDMTYQEVPCESKHLYAVITSTNSHLGVVFAGGKGNIAEAVMYVDGEARPMIRGEGATWMAPPISKNGLRNGKSHDQEPGLVSFELSYSDNTTTIIDDNCFESSGITEGSVCIGDGKSLPDVSDAEEEVKNESSAAEETDIINSSEASDVAEDAVDESEGATVAENTNPSQIREECNAGPDSIPFPDPEKVPLTDNFFSRDFAEYIPEGSTCSELSELAANTDSNTHSRHFKFCDVVVGLCAGNDPPSCDVCPWGISDPEKPLLGGLTTCGKILSDLQDFSMSEELCKETDKLLDHYECCKKEVSGGDGNEEVSCCIWEDRATCPFWTQNKHDSCQSSADNCSRCGGNWIKSGRAGEEEYD